MIVAQATHVFRPGPMVVLHAVVHPSTALWAARRDGKSAGSGGGPCGCTSQMAAHQTQLLRNCYSWLGCNMASKAVAAEGPNAGAGSQSCI